MSTNLNITKMVVGTLLSGGIAAAALGLTVGTAAAAPNPGPRIDYSDFAGPIVECNQCQSKLPGDGSVRINPGQVRINIPSVGH